MDLILIRHPEVAIAPGVCYGSSDIALRDPAALAVPSLLAKMHAKSVIPSVLYSSPLQRCALVAAALARSLSCEVQIDTRLAEMDFGNWEMRAWDDIPYAEVNAWAADVEAGRPHGGENTTMLANRTASWLSDAMQDASASTSASTSASASASASASTSASASASASTSTSTSTSPCIVAVTHAGVIRVLTAAALGFPALTCLPWSLSTSGICHLRKHAAPNDPLGARWSLVQWNG